ncbi:MAG: phospho-N-acetylmuramoyl-pentapeptide-transferase [Bacillota bacterium]
MREVYWAAGVAFLIGVIVGPVLLPILRRLKAGQSVREYMHKEQLKKTGTPIMGGLLIWVALLSTVVALGALDQYTLIALVITLGNALIGFLDDYMKVVLKRPLGLKARYKLLGQVAFAAIIYFLVAIGRLSTSIVVPYFNWKWPLGPFYVPFVVLELIGMSNAANLTDGMDGLCGGVTLIISLFYTLVALVTEQYNLAIFAAALSGGIAAFLVFNLHPAKMFMGDTGSLGLGAAVAALAVFTKTELLLVIVGGIYVIEVLSDIIQVTYYQMTGGKRVFRMAPIHYHFQLGGWSEWKVVGSFWFTGLILAALALIGLKGMAL